MDAWVQIPPPPPSNNWLYPWGWQKKMVVAKEDTVLKRVPSHNTFIRYYETLRKINLDKDRFNFSDLIKILGDKDY